MCYRGVRGVVPTDGIRPGQMIVKFLGWPPDMVMQMRLWHIVMAEPLHKRHPLPRQIALEHMSMSYRRGQSRKSMTRQENIGLTRYRCCQVARYGGTHSAALRSALLPFPASSLPRELVSGRHLPLPEAVGWPRPPYCTIWQTTCRSRES